jgi:hypothetical protein
LLVAAGAVAYLGHLVRQRIRQSVGDLAPQLEAEESAGPPSRSGLWTTMGLAFSAGCMLIAAVSCHIAKMV